MILVAVAVSGKMMIVSFAVLLMVVSWVAPLVAGSVGSDLSHTVVLASLVPVSACLLGLVWGWFSYLMSPGYFVRSWHTSYRLLLRVSRLDRKCTKLVSYTPFCCDLPHRTSSIFARLCSPVVLVGVDKILVALT